MLVTSLVWFALLAMASPPTQAGFVDVPGGPFASSVRSEAGDRVRNVDGFAMAMHAVTVRQFEDFLRTNTRWRRDNVPSLLADGGYLSHWERADGAGATIDPHAPVTQVSRFAADAYCSSIGARLPDWIEWEYVAAADATRHDSRGDASRHGRLLDDGTPRAVDAHAGAIANVYGVSGLHGAVWEWVGDHASLLGDADKRGGDDGDRLRFCGAAGLSFNNRDDYTVLKRVALLSAVTPRSTLGNLGFRCVRSSQ